MRHRHRVQGDFQLFLPEIQEALQLRKIGEQIIGLPYVGLQQPAVIRPAVQDLRGGQTVAFDLFPKVLRNHHSSSSRPEFPVPDLHIASRNSKQTVENTRISSSPKNLRSEEHTSE